MTGTTTALGLLERLAIASIYWIDMVTGSCLLWVMSTEISVDIAVDTRSILGRQLVDIAVDTRSILGRDRVDSRSKCVSADIVFRSPTLRRLFADTSPTLRR